MATYNVTVTLKYQWLVSGSEPGQSDLLRFRESLARKLASSFETSVSVSAIKAWCEGGLIFGAFPTPITPKTCTLKFSVSSDKRIDKDALAEELKAAVQREQMLLGLIPAAFLVQTDVFVEESIIPPIDIPIELGGISEIVIWGGAGFLGAWLLAKLVSSAFKSGRRGRR